MVGTLTESPLLINDTLQAYHTADVKLYNEIYPEHAAELDALEVQLEAQEAERTSIWEDIYAWFEDDEAGAQQGADASATAADGAETFALDGLDPEQAFLDDNRDALFAQLQTLIAEGKSPDEAIVALGHTIQSTPATGVDAAQLYTVLARDNQFSGMVADIEQNGAQISAPTPTVAGPTNTFVLNS